MVFVWFDQGVRVPPPPQLPPIRLRVEPIERMGPSHKVGKDGPQIQSLPKRRVYDPIHQHYQRMQEPPRPRQPALHAHHIMTSPVLSLDAEASVAQAWAFICQRRFRHVPVICHPQKLVGIFSDRDLLREAAGLGKARAPGAPAADVSRPVREIMTTRVLTASPNTEIRQIAQVLFDEHIGTMPIIDEREHLIGLITRSDILQALIKPAPLDLWV
jgi:CBS-domain-containing membrane protein